jgi:hypothetical protein
MYYSFFLFFISLSFLSFFWVKILTIPAQRGAPGTLGAI